MLMLSETQLHKVVKDYVSYFNRARPHQALSQQLPESASEPLPTSSAALNIVSKPVLGGLHHHYRCAA
jgi:putative transposase